MKEHCYIITPDSQHHSEYLLWKENRNAIIEAFDNFAREYSISATKYLPREDQLAIIPTEDDLVRFGGQLTNPGEAGLRRFKKTSKIGKAWQLLGLEPLKKPFVPFFFQNNEWDNQSTSLFDYKGIVYCTIENDCDNMDTPYGFVLMERSEFFKIVEEMESED